MWEVPQFQNLFHTPNNQQFETEEHLLVLVEWNQDFVQLRSLCLLLQINYLFCVIIHVLFSVLSSCFLKKILSVVFVEVFNWFLWNQQRLHLRCSVCTYIILFLILYIITAVSFLFAWLFVIHSQVTHFLKLYILVF